jgi:proline iminopeptidase
MTTMSIRGVSLFVEVIGAGPPLLLMHGGPGTDHWTLLPFRRLSDQFTLVFYDHRCNGRSVGPPVMSMTWDNLTADADAIRESLGFERWAVLGHSFGGHVALEYALRYPDRVSELVLLDTGADAGWARDNAPKVALERGHDEKTTALVRRWFHGQIEAGEMRRILMRLGPLYDPHISLLGVARMVFRERRSILSPEAFIHAGQTLLKDWTVVDRLDEISAPTLVLAGRDDFVFPPECQRQLATGIPSAALRLIDDAGHNPQDEAPDQVIAAVRAFLMAEVRDLVTRGVVS